LSRSAIAVVEFAVPSMWEIITHDPANVTPRTAAGQVVVVVVDVEVHEGGQLLTRCKTDQLIQPAYIMIMQFGTFYSGLEIIALFYFPRHRVHKRHPMLWLPLHGLPQVLSYLETRWTTTTVCTGVCDLA
jgi:hypothetical protein